MKKLILLLAVVLLFITSADAQVKPETIAMVAGAKPALTIFLPDVDPKFAQSIWKEYLKPYGKVSSVKGSKETVVESIHISAIGEGNLLEVYNLAEEATGGSRMIMWVDLGTEYLTPADTHYYLAENFLLKFGLEVKIAVVANDLDAQKKQLDKLQSNYEKLQKTNEKLIATIEDAKATISAAEIGIPANERDQEVARASIDNQKAVVETVRDDPKELKSQQKELAKLQKNLDNLERAHESYHKDIESSTATIAQAEQDIKDNLRDQELAQKDIDNQNKVIEVVQKKLDDLKDQKL